MPLPKPSTHINWAVGNPDFSLRVVEPSNAKKQAAWLDDERPPAPFFNWLFNTLDEWAKYFESITDEQATVYDAIVGGGGAAQTHATLQAAVADGALSANARILVRADQSLTGPINLTKAGWRIEFAPGVTFSKNTGTVGLSLEAAGIVIQFGRMTGYTTGGDKAIDMTAAAEYCQILGMRFGPSTDTEVDDTLVPAGKKPRVETMTEV